MTRSVWKGPFVDGYLLRKAEAARGSGRKDVIKIWELINKCFEIIDEVTAWAESCKEQLEKLPDVVDALPGFASETLLLAPLGVAYLIWCELVAGNGVMTNGSVGLYVADTRLLSRWILDNRGAREVTRDGTTVRFVPGFPPSQGVTYVARAAWHRSRLSEHDASRRHPGARRGEWAPGRPRSVVRPRSERDTVLRVVRRATRR